jgi:hypothetical protein
LALSVSCSTRSGRHWRAYLPRIEGDAAGDGVALNLLASLGGDAGDLGVDGPVQVGRHEVGALDEAVAGCLELSMFTGSMAVMP